MLITYARLRDVIYHNSRSWSLRSWLFKALDDSSKLLHLWVDYGLQLLGGDDVLVGTWTKAQLPPSTVTLQPNRPATQVTGSMISGFLDVLSRHSTGSTMLHNAPQCSTGQTLTVKVLWSWLCRGATRHSSQARDVQAGDGLSCLGPKVGNI